MWDCEDSNDDTRNKGTKTDKPGGGGAGSPQILWRGVVLEYLNDTTVYTEEELILRFGGAPPEDDDPIEEDDDSDDQKPPTLQNPNALKGYPRNACIVAIVDKGNAKSAGPLVAYPLFPPHMCMPVVPGEQVLLISPIPGNFGQIIYWISRAPENALVDDINYTHADRRLNAATGISTDEELDKIVETPSPGSTTPFLTASFPNGDGGNATSLPPDSADEEMNPYNVVVINSLSYQDFNPEPVPRFTSQAGDLVMQGSNNAMIRCGEDRGWKDYEQEALAEGFISNALKTSFEKERGGFQGTIDIVAGRSRFWPKLPTTLQAAGDPAQATAPQTIQNTRTPEMTIADAPEFKGDPLIEVNKDLAKNALGGGENKNIAFPPEGDPDFMRDSSRIYTSMKTSGDIDFGLIPERMFDDYKGQIPQTIPAINTHDDSKGVDIPPVLDSPYVILKSDEIRIIARQDENNLVNEDGVPVPIQGSIKIIKEGIADDITGLGRGAIVIEKDGTVIIDSPKIVIGSGADAKKAANGEGRQVVMGYEATEPMVLGDQLVGILSAIIDVLDNHIHPSGAGPTSPRVGGTEKTPIGGFSGTAKGITDLKLLLSKMGKLL